MRSAGDESYLKQRQLSLLREHSVVGYHRASVRSFSLSEVNMHYAVLCVLFHPTGKSSALFFHIAVNCTQITLCNLSGTDLFVYTAQRLGGLGSYNYSSGIAVDAVAQCRGKAPLRIRVILSLAPQIGKDIVYQRVALIDTAASACAVVSAVYSHSGFFVDKDDLFILIDYIYVRRYRAIRLGFRFSVIGQQIIGQKQLQGISLAELLRYIGSGAVHLYFFLAYCLVHQRLRQQRQTF